MRSLFQNSGHHEHTVEQCQTPGNGVGNADAEVAQTMNGQPAAERAADELAHTGDNGLHTVSQTLQGVAEDHQQAVDAEQHADHGQVFHSTGSHGRVGIAQNKAHGPALDEEEHHPGSRAVAQLEDAAIPDALPDAVSAVGTVVLADISCHSRAHACHGHGEHLANLLTGGLGGHGGAAQQVDGILHDEGTDGRNGILKAHRKADIGQPPAVPRREDTVFPGEMDALHPGEEPPGAKQAAEQLADNGGDGCALHAHTQRYDEQPVQPDVQETGD